MHKSKSKARYVHTIEPMVRGRFADHLQTARKKNFCPQTYHEPLYQYSTDKCKYSCLIPLYPLKIKINW